MYFQFTSVVVMLLLGAGLCGLMLGLGALLRPSNPHPGKLATYECGEPPSGPAWINFNIRFYLIALVFVIFDVELAFIYPVAAVFRDWVVTRGRGLFALGELSIFVGILAVGLVYVWAKGDLQWLKRLPRARHAADGGVREAA
jgi:NADH-quinone oxidoreductase subunit A